MPTPPRAHDEVRDAIELGAAVAGEAPDVFASEHTAPAHGYETAESLAGKDRTQRLGARGDGKGEGGAHFFTRLRNRSASGQVAK